MSSHQPTTEQVVAALEDAKVLIARGWCKGRAQNKDEYCVVGALAEATTTDPDSDVPGYLLWRNALAAINTQVPAPWPNAVAYNDGTDQKTILELVDNAITYVKNMGGE